MSQESNSNSAFRTSHIHSLNGRSSNGHSHHSNLDPKLEREIRRVRKAEYMANLDLQKSVLQFKDQKEDFKRKMWQQNQSSNFTETLIKQEVCQANDQMKEMLEMIKYQ